MSCREEEGPSAVASSVVAPPRPGVALCRRRPRPAAACRGPWMRRRAVDSGPDVAAAVPAPRPHAMARGCTAAAASLLAWRGRRPLSAAAGVGDGGGGGRGQGRRPEARRRSVSGEMRRLAGAGTPDAHRAEGMDAHRARKGGGPGGAPARRGGRRRGFGVGAWGRRLGWVCPWRRGRQGMRGGGRRTVKAEGE